ncbi:MAG: HDOD domain-containing protein [Phycisphaerales bacterium]|nr:HDOD domain-containing protein [Phycisphaerales bacterium]
MSSNNTAQEQQSTTPVKSADEIVGDAIREISHIATLPEITVRIIELVEDPTSTAQDLHNVVSNDPALCSRILKVVNSSFYGLPGQIGSINRAIVLLGLNAVKNIAISASLAKLFRGGQLCPGFSARDLWMHAVATAAGCKLVADKLQLGIADEAFLSGLVHDIGIMVEMQSNRNKLIEVVAALGADKDGIPQSDMLAAEKKIFGADHQMFGKGLCEKWKFPAVFSNVCGFHHNPLDLASGSRNLPCIVYVADRLAAGLSATSFRLDLLDTELDHAVLDELRMSSDKLAEVREELPERYEDVALLLT